MIDDGGAGQSFDHIGNGLVIARRRHAAVPLQPANLGAEMARIGDETGRAVQPVVIDIGDFRLGAAVHPGEAGRQRFAARRYRDAAIELAAQRQRRHIVRRCPG